MFIYTLLWTIKSTKKLKEYGIYRNTDGYINVLVLVGALATDLFILSGVMAIVLFILFEL